MTQINTDDCIASYTADSIAASTKITLKSRLTVASRNHESRGQVK